MASTNPWHQNHRASRELNDLPLPELNCADPEVLPTRPPPRNHTWKAKLLIAFCCFVSLLVLSLLGATIGLAVEYVKGKHTNEALVLHNSALAANVTILQANNKQLEDQLTNCLPRSW